jgi:flavin reductase ActVB
MSENFALLPMLRNALANFPSGVTIVSTIDENGRPWGFTASSFSAVSMEPPLISVCLARTAESFNAFTRAQRFAVNILGQEHQDLAMRFSRKGVDKFAGGEFLMEEGSPPMLPGAVSAFICRARPACEAGDHVILLGEVEQVHVAGSAPLVYFNRNFWTLEGLETEQACAAA